MFKFINNLLPQVISSVFTSVQDTHSHSTIELNWKVDRAIPRFVEGCDSLCVYSCNRVTVSETKFGVQKSMFYTAVHDAQCYQNICSIVDFL